MTAQRHNRFVFCVVVVEFAVNGNQALWKSGLIAFVKVYFVKTDFDQANFDHANDQF